MAKQQAGKRKRPHFNKAVKRSQQEAAEIKALEAAIQAGTPPPGTFVVGSNSSTAPASEAAQSFSEVPLRAAQGTASLSYAAAKRFDELPISQYTKDGLKEADFVTLTAIQRAALPQALCGRDILGAAKTGSGKTLAFLIPALEKLYRLHWSRLDGLGALVISPTRELALQIFDELTKVGKRHDFSAGLLIGGKKVKEEQERVNGMTILICTPGRLLQHMDETPGFDCSKLEVLVLDEADRILDMGFSASVNAIIRNLPKHRQTMLFSATQTKSVKDLARLSLKDPEYIAVHAEAAAPTPLKLQQAYMVCELHEKVDVLWSFIKAHLKSKVIVFLSTCKQVKYMLEAFRKLRPGVPLRSLHGKMKQAKRMAAFYEFCEAKAGMVLFATDIAARGLDFPTVDWVVQADCPEDVPAYIHRVGRTARYVAGGKALLLLVPSEKDAMLSLLGAAHVPIKAIKMNPNKTQAVTPALQALLSKGNDLKELAQRALVSYLRSVFLQPNHEVFRVEALPAAEYALSLGLSSAPKLRFLKRAGKKMKEIHVGGNAHVLEAAGGQPAKAAAGSENKPAQDQADALPAEHAGGAGDSDDGNDLLVVKRRNVLDVEAAPADGELPAAKKPKKLRIKLGKPSGTRVVFDKEGTAKDPLAVLALEELDRDGHMLNAEGLYVGEHGTAADRFKQAKLAMKHRDVADRAAQREAKRAKRLEQKAKRRAREAGEVAEGAAPIAMLGGSGSEGESESGSYGGYGRCTCKGHQRPIAIA
ncbi:hypothetical protein WJX72_008381 [[Myrmecia] bisecta]|uniref:ATP-dependent RNA helicase n=1 Tax=[Myrmecia] bisecta TaxID=41462 RepID=A0AAW1PXB9_9CHLO